jgi:uncharacterized membrane protein YhaH (DUF805 family)
MIDKYFSFSGRATRSEFWGVFLICYLAVMPIVVLLSVLLGIVGVALAIASTIASFILMFATSARRCRDAGISPWFSLVTFVTIIPIIVFGCLPTEKENNEHQN